MTKMSLYINGEKIPMNAFVRNVIHDVNLAVVSHLKNVEIEEITRIEISGE
ncbi:MAG: hypothetical protein R6V83_07875 [Candidatus Thorarchaeota archaeon]